LEGQNPEPWAGREPMGTSTAWLSLTHEPGSTERTWLDSEGWLGEVHGVQGMHSRDFGSRNGHETVLIRRDGKMESINIEFLIRWTRARFSKTPGGTSSSWSKKREAPNGINKSLTLPIGPDIKADGERRERKKTFPLKLAAIQKKNGAQATWVKSLRYR